MGNNGSDKGFAKRPYPKGFRIEYPGVITLLEFRQCLWQDMHELEDRGVEFIKHGQLFVPITNMYGDPLILKNEDGTKPKFWTSHGYRSAAWDYKL